VLSWPISSVPTVEEKLLNRKENKGKQFYYKSDCREQASRSMKLKGNSQKRGQQVSSTEIERRIELLTNFRFHNTPLCRQYGIR